MPWCEGKKSIEALTFKRGRSTSLRMRDLAVAFALTGRRGAPPPPKIKGFAVSFTLMKDLVVAFPLTGRWGRPAPMENLRA